MPFGDGLAKFYGQPDIIPVRLKMSSPYCQGKLKKKRRILVKKIK